MKKQLSTIYAKHTSAPKSPNLPQISIIFQGVNWGLQASTPPSQWAGNSKPPLAPDMI